MGRPHVMVIPYPEQGPVAYGASEEIGPFRISKGGSGLYLNKFAWNSLANLLLLEAPAPVYLNQEPILINYSRFTLTDGSVSCHCSQRFFTPVSYSMASPVSEIQPP
ncbi:hypothetical protein YC2023_063504 [Brassica napus]